MATVQIDLVSPSGVPCVLTVTKDDDQADIIATLERAAAVGSSPRLAVKSCWSFQIRHRDCLTANGFRRNRASSAAL